MFAAKFPTRRSREFLPKNREFRRKNREFTERPVRASWIGGKYLARPRRRIWPRKLSFQRFARRDEFTDAPESRRCFESVFEGARRCLRSRACATTRIADADGSIDAERFIIQLQTRPSSIRALKATLKVLWRCHRLRCISVREVAKGSPRKYNPDGNFSKQYLAQNLLALVE